MKKSNKKGFTLVELLVAISIFGIIMLLAIPQLMGLRDDNKNTKYEKYSDSVVTSAKLYTDSYAKDMFGNNSSGCYDIPYKKLAEKNLAKDIKVDDLTCDTYNGSNPTTFVRVYKSQDIYLYDIAIKCVDKNNKVVYEKNLNGDICNGKRSDESGPTIEISGIENGWTTGRDSSGNPLKATVTIEDSYGLKENVKFLYVWTKDISNLDSLTYKTHSFTNSREEAIRTLSFDIEYPQNENGLWYLVIKPGPDGIRDLNGNYHLETHTVSPVVKLDNTPPVITNLVNSKDGVWTNQPVTVSGTISDAHSGVKKIYYSYKNDGTNKTAFGTGQITSGGNGPFNVSNTWNTNTNESIYVIGEDSVGNKTVVMPIGKIMLDVVKPTCNVVLTGKTGTNGWYKEENVKISLDRMDAYSGVQSYGLTTSASETYNSTASNTQGDTNSTIWYGYVKDKAGNTNKCSSTMKVDTTQPTCTISKTGTSGNNGWYKSDVTLTVVPNDALSGIAKTALSTSSNPTLGTTTTGTQTETSGTIWYGRVQDKAGNISNVCNSGTVKVDKTKPSISWVTSAGPHNSSGSLTVKTTCSDSLSGVGSHTESSSVASPTTGTSKTHTCTDKAGNTSSTSRTFKVKTYGRDSSCGIESYKSCPHSSCGIESYKSCATSACGYAKCRTSSCGVESYKTCTSSACGTKTCTSSCSGIPGSPATVGNSACSGYTASQCTCGYTASTQVHCSCSKSCGYKSCATSSCGVSSYKSCAASACGYATCRASACGVASYKSCRHSSCGVDKYKECWHY